MATDQRELDPTRGFRHFGEFAVAVANVAIPGAHTRDERLLIAAAAPGTVGSEGVGQDGGFAIPPAYAQEIWTHAAAEDALLPLTDQTPVSGNSMVFPKDETLPWGTDGMRAYWQNEATVGTQTRPKLGTNILRMSKLLALVPLSDELLADGPALAAYLPARCGNAIRWKANEAILFGKGNGQPQGALNSGAQIVVAKEAGQATLTFDAKNFRKMAAAMPPGSYGRAIWLIGPDAIEPLFSTDFKSYPLYPVDTDDPEQPALSGPIALLLGRPCYSSQHAAAFSAQGDVLLLDLQYYRTISKMLTQLSLDFWFDSDIAAFRVSFRIDGQSKIVAPLVQAKGSITLSPFVQLAAR